MTFEPAFFKLGAGLCRVIDFDGIKAVEDFCGEFLSGGGEGEVFGEGLNCFSSSMKQTVHLAMFRIKPSITF